MLDNQVVKNKQTIANAFNKFYINLGKNLAENIPNGNNDPLSYLSELNCLNSLFLYPTDEDEILSIVNRSKNTGIGWDGISAKLVKCSIRRYVAQLAYIVNLSLTQGVFPDELKIAKVIPLFKSGDHKLIKNYRPVSVLPYFSKIFERIVLNRITKFINQNESLYPFQFGFRANHNTSNALMVIIDRILSGFNNGEMTIGVFLDFSKAFDTVDHEILKKKLIHYGIRGSAHQWLISYLSNRKQYVHYDGATSNSGDILCGVPQGSILGPLLFILYINDISKVSNKIHPVLFADDSNFFIQGKNLSEMVSTLNNELVSLVYWINANKLSLNIEKTNFILFKQRNKQTDMNDEIQINTTSISRIYQTKFLGVVISSDLSWDHHTKYVCSKISKGIGIIYKARFKLNLQSLVSLYYSFVYPYLSYCLEVWGSTTKKNLLSLHKKQKKVIRLVIGADYCAHTEPLFLRLKILNVYRLYEYNVGLFMFKYHRGDCPSSLDYMFIQNTFIHNYSTRQKYNYHVPHFRLSICLGNIRYKGVVIWNKVRENINTECSYITFKSRLKHCLLFDNLTT